MELIDLYTLSTILDYQDISTAKEYVRNLIDRFKSPIKSAPREQLNFLSLNGEVDGSPEATSYKKLSYSPSKRAEIYQYHLDNKSLKIWEIAGHFNLPLSSVTNIIMMEKIRYVNELVKKGLSVENACIETNIKQEIYRSYKRKKNSTHKRSCYTFPLKLRKEVYEEYKNGKKTSSIARKFNINQSSLMRIIREEKCKEAVYLIQEGGYSLEYAANAMGVKPSSLIKYMKEFEEKKNVT